jgi:ATP-binding protein involved in chromosome partitioning
MSQDALKEAVLSALRTVKSPGGRDLVAMNVLSDIVVQSGKVYFSIEVPPAQTAKAFEPLRKAAEDAVKALPGVTGVVVSLTADSRQAKPQAAAPEHAPGSPERGIGGVKYIVAVASGKGGVGKSTTAVNLALALHANGLRTGILDADVYGPSLPRLLAINGKPDLVGENLLAPMERYGLKVMSMGFLVEEETPMIWRGPMVMSAISQMLKDVAWGALDVIVVDMPPGTGDAQLTLAQQVPLAGAVIVSTPQDLALIDARKGLNMFKRVNVPVLGIVENMSFFVCPNCNHRSDIFAHGGARREAERLGVPFLGELPLHMAIRETSDGGHPIVAKDPMSLHAQLYKHIAAAVWDAVSNGAGQKAPPKIVIE